MALPTRRDYMSSMARADCGICLQPLTQSTSTTCRHYFCRGCIRAWLRSNNTCPTCRAELFSDGAQRPRARERLRQEQPRRELNESVPVVDGQHGEMQTLSEIREMLRGAGLEEGELEMQEDLWNEVQRPTPSHDRRRSVANHATGQAVRSSQPIFGRNSTPRDVALPEPGHRHQVQSPGESTATTSSLHSTEMPSHTLGNTVEDQGDLQPSALGRQTATSCGHNGQRVEANSELTYDEISALSAQLGMSRSQTFVCNSAAMDRLMRRLQSEQDAQPEWHTEIKDRDVLYTFKLRNAMFAFYWISFDAPSWCARLPSGQERSDFSESLYDHHRKWRRNFDSYFLHVAPNLLDREVRYLMQEESANPLEEHLRFV